MFSPRQKSTALNNSFVKSPGVTPSRTRRSLYIPKNKSFFSPLTTGRNKNQNASEFQLTLNEQPTDYKLSIHDGWMPVNVTDILANIDGLPPRAKINDKGLAWIVAKDKLLLWNISPEKSNACYELQLPFVALEREEADDIVLVATIETEDYNISCLAITSEGSAVFWNCVAYPRSFIEVKVLSGRGSSDFCVDLVAIADGFLIGWLSGTLTYIQISQGQLKQITLRAQQGRLTNISRRFSSIIFGSSQSTSSSIQTGSLKRLLPGDDVEESGWELFVLLESHLQKWIISSPPLSEKLVYEINLEVLINSSMEQILGIECDAVALQDIQLTRNGLSILFASITNSVAKYGIALLDTVGMEPPSSLAKVLMSDVESPLLGDGEAKTYKLLWPDRSSDTNCFFYNLESVVCFKDNEEEGLTCEVVNFSSIGAGCYCGFPLFISNQGTLVKVQESVVAANRCMADSLLKSKTFSNVESSALGNTSVVRLSELSQSKEPLTRFKAIFISTMCNPTSHQQLNKTTAMLSELFSPNLGEGCDVEQLDSLVVHLSQEMIDDCPSSDPRWAESRTSEISIVSSTLILGHQLDDKLKAQEAFLSFLKSNNIWDRLGMSDLREGQAPTCRVLCENSEKLVAATALKDIHHDWSEVVDPAMERCIEKRKSFISAQGSLKPQDVFYKEVSKLHEIFEQIVEVERLHLGSSNVETSPQTLHAVHGVSAIFRDVLGKALSFRRSKSDFYKNSIEEKGNNSSGFKMAVPWTSGDSIMMPLFKQHSILCNEVIPLVRDAGQLNALFQDLLDTTDLILDGMVTVIHSLGESEKSRKEDLHKKYEHTRMDLLAPFVRHKQYERAMSLAEKYCDFELLVQICDTIHDECRLEEYMKKFDGKGFPEVVFDWYCKSGKRGKLFAPKVMGHPRLEEFLRRPENRFMSWVYDVLIKNYSSAHETLFELAQIESASVIKRRTLLSSAKLYALLAKDPSFDVEERIAVIDNNLQLVSHQETLFQNQGVLEYLAIDSFSASRVYSAIELIDLQIGPCIQEANEYEFKKAFDLLKFCNNEDQDHPIRDILIDIWVKAILRDDWGFSLSITDPISSCKDTIFFKFLELVLSEVLDIEAVLPSIDELLEHEDMECFHGDAEFRCKLMVIYEQARRMNM